MAALDEWYHGYRFAQDARNDLFHPKLVLHYLAKSIPNEGPPDDLIDRDVRIDYHGYRFAQDARNDLFHPKLVLHYLAKSIPNEGPPDDLIDRDVRIDYGKLFHLLTANRQLGDNFGLLRQLACEGTVSSAVRSGFPMEELTEPENLPSLLYYFGLLSIGAARETTPLLRIPNQTARHLLCGQPISHG